MQDYTNKQQKTKPRVISSNNENLDEIISQQHENSVVSPNLANLSSPRPNIPTIMRLQSLIGNQGVQRLLDSSPNTLQREEQPEPEPEPELDDSDEADIDAELAALFAKHKNIPTFEAITVSTAARQSTGELEQEVMRLWQHQEMSFTKAARHAAKANTVGDKGPRATSGPEFQSDIKYGKRWSLDLIAWDYKKYGDLEAVRELLKKGSPYQKAQREEFEKVTNVENPKAADIKSNIYKTIMELWQTLDVENGEVGELVVVYSGHGGGNGIAGVDEEDVTLRELMALGELANDFNVHLVYMIDSCHMGALANAAQLSSLKQMNKDASEMPEDQQAAVESKTGFANTFIRKVIGLSNAIVMVDHASDDWRKKRRKNKNARKEIEALRKGYHEAVINLGDMSREYAEFLASAENLKGLEKSDGVPELSELIEMANQIAEESKTASTIEYPDQHLVGIAKSTDIMLDTSNDIINQFLVQIHAEMDNASNGQPAAENSQNAPAE